MIIHEIVFLKQKRLLYQIYVSFKKINKIHYFLHLLDKYSELVLRQCIFNYTTTCTNSSNFYLVFRFLNISLFKL